MSLEPFISTNYKSQISAWILMAVVLVTIIPFNLFHNHSEDIENNTELALVQNNEDHKTCDHEVHLAEEQEACFLCHFAFISEYADLHSRFADSTSLEIDELPNQLYQRSNGLLAVYSILNKGSPLI